MSHDNMAFTDPPAQAEADATDYGSKRSEEFNIPIDPVYHQSTPPYGGDNPSFGEKNGSPLASVFVVQEATKEITEDPYDPHEHRQISHPTTNLETLIHLLKGSLGTGILAMPRAFLHSGYALGVIGTVVIGFICTYCIHLLVKAQHELCKRRRQPMLSYPETAHSAMEAGPKFFQKLAPFSGHVVNAFLLIYQLGTCCVYVVFVAENVKAVVEQYQPKMDVRLYMAGLLIPLVLLNWVRNLKYMAPLTTLANVLTFLGFGITTYYLFRDPFDPENRHPIGNFKDFPLFFGTVLFALEAIGVILPLENNMKTPRSFVGKCGVLNIAMTSIVILYVGMGFMGYLRYGEFAKASITLDLPDDEILAQSVKIMLAFAIFITHGLQCYVAVDISWNHYLLPMVEKKPNQLLMEYLVRTCLVLVTFLLAVAVPNLEVFISLFGALCLSALGIAFPALIQTSVFWYSVEGKRFWFMVLKNAILVLFALLGLVTGTYTSLIGLMSHFD